MRVALWMLLPMLLAAGCASSPPLAQGHRVHEIRGNEPDAQLLARCAARMEQSLAFIQRLRDPTRQDPDFLAPRDQDMLEHSWSDYLACRQALEQIATRQERQNAELSEASRQCKTQYDAHLASLAVEDPVLWRALNQSFHRSGIPQDSGERILHELTDSRTTLASESAERMHNVIRHRALLLPEVENELRHTQPAQFLKSTGETISSRVEKAQHLVVTGTGRIKNPAYRQLTIPPEQRREVRAALLPGDIVLTYAAGYVTNLFVPGSFKHALTFVGTEEERRAVGYPAERLLAAAGARSERLAAALAQTTTKKSGKPADVVEAISEGVLLNNLDELLETRVNRLVVFRPRLTEAERAEQLIDVLSYVGDDFDFDFDLTDASDQVCTEVVYRSLQGRGGARFTLSEIVGRMTLTPDDIVRYCTRHAGEQFDCILGIDGAPMGTGKARITTGAAAQEWVAGLLGEGARSVNTATAEPNRQAKASRRSP